MKKIIFACFAMAISATSMAASNSTASSTSNSNSTGISSSGASAGATGGASSSGVLLKQQYAGTDLSNAVPSAMAPNLATTLTETCMGSTSFGASGSGFGFSFGTTWRDGACVRRLDARQLSAFGDLPTARELMCDSDKVREAARRAGRPCVADGGQPWGVPVVAAPQEQVAPTPEAAAPVVREQVRE
ncbi:MAG: hypothetical protein QXN55_00580 [Candidatus Nitrosotenuis sp.]